MFDSTCSATLSFTAPPFGTCVRPEQSLGALEGLTLPPSYRFRISDASRGDTGSIGRLALVICAAP